MATVTLQDVEVVWGGAQAAQMTFVRNLYDAMVKLLNLGDWELGYKSCLLYTSPSPRD